MDIWRSASAFSFRSLVASDKPGRMSVEIQLAESLPHALELLSAGDPQVRPLAGATDLMVRTRAGRVNVRRLISIADLQDLCFIHPQSDGLRVGAGTPLSDLWAHQEFCAEFPAAAEALRQFASPQIRNRATAGGNIANASPAADLVPALIALGASVTLSSRNQVRELPVEDLFLGFGKTVIRPDELVTSLFIPRRRGTFQAFAKFGSRGANVIAVINMSLCLTLEQDRIRQARVAYGSVAPKPWRSTAVEQFLAGRALSEELIRELEPVVRADVSPIDDVRGSRRYKQRLAANATQDALRLAYRQVRA